MKDLKKYFEKFEKPIFTLNSRYLLDKYKAKEGKDFGQKIKLLENIWLNNSFKLSRKEIDEINNKLLNMPLYDNKIIVHIDNPDGRVKFKDIRKISIGINSKDLLFSRIKDKSAFYNCFVVLNLEFPLYLKF